MDDESKHERESGGQAAAADGDRTRTAPDESGRGNRQLWETVRLALNTSRRGPSLAQGVARGVAPLSFAQEGLWLFNQLAPESPAHHYHTANRLTGAVDIAAMQKGLNEIIRRHEALRCTFHVCDGRPVQRVEPPYLLQLPLVDLTQFAADEREPEARRLLIEDARQPFNLETGPLLRAKMLRLTPRECVLLLVVHHIVFDDQSLEILFHELSCLYTAFAAGQHTVRLPEIPVQYPAYACWEQQRLQEEIVQRQLDFWRRQLHALPPALELPMARPRSATPSLRGARIPFLIPQDVGRGLRELGRGEETTLSTLLLGAFAVLLFRYTGQNDIAVGAPVSSRTRREMKRLVGLFLNTLVLRMDLSGDPTFHELLERVRHATADAYAHREAPFAVLAQEFGDVRRSNWNPLYEVLFVYNNARHATLRLPRVESSRLALDLGASSTGLTLFMRDEGPALSGIVSYDMAMFDPLMMERMVAHYQTLLRGIVANPGERISKLPLLTDDERCRLLVEWNRTTRDFPSRMCAHQLFEQHVKRHPSAVAVASGTRHMTYEQLDLQAERVARLLQERGIGPDVPVGICMKTSPEMVVGVLGTLKAGGVYVPLDPAYPKARLTRMLTEAGVRVLLTVDALTSGLPGDLIPTIHLDDVAGPPERDGAEKTHSAVTYDHLAYLIFTSGSTGVPKGAAVYHRGFTNLLHWFTQRFGIGEDDRFLLVSSFAFDLSQKNILGPLAVGARLVLPDLPSYDPERLLQIVAQQHITILNCTPSAFYPMVEMAERREFLDLASLRHLFLGGEAIALPRLRKWMASGACTTQIVNTYGPTECTDVCAYYPLDGSAALPEGTIPIGKPIANAQLYILDANNSPVPVGVVGELCIGGVPVGKGYVNNPELTRQQFIPNPFGRTPDERLYRTGDLARQLPDGNIHLLGRLDDQIKIRGFRIQLGEIETVISEHPLVREAAVVAREVKSGDVQLVAYVVPRGSDTSITSQLRLSLKEQLPHYMIPSTFVSMVSLPLTPNGKVDRRSLAEPGAAPSDDSVAPATGVGQILAGIWQDVLGVEQVGARDDFFERGGHSLLAITLRSRVETVFGVQLPLFKMFECSTLADQSRLIEDQLLGGMGETELAQSLGILEGLSDEEVECLIAREWATMDRPERE